MKLKNFHIQDKQNLNSKEKDFLADLILKKGFKVSYVAELFEISKVKIKNYTYRRKRHSFNYDRVGRYKKIDCISDKLIKDEIKVMNKNDLKHLIVKEATNSFIRKHSSFRIKIVNDNYFKVNRKYKIVSDKTIKRYLKYYSDYIDSEIINNEENINHYDYGSIHYQENTSIDYNYDDDTSIQYQDDGIDYEFSQNELQLNSYNHTNDTNDIKSSSILYDDLNIFCIVILYIIMYFILMYT